MNKEAWDLNLLALFRRRLAELSLEASYQKGKTEIQLGTPFELELRLDYSTAHFTAFYLEPMTFQALQQVVMEKRYGRILLLGQKIHERSAQMLRDNFINYLDASGNAFIKFDGVHIDVRGKKESIPLTRESSHNTRGGVNLFSTKRAQVIFAVLCWPELLHRPVRELAAAAKVSIGLAQQTVEVLSGSGFIDHNRTISRQRDMLITLWSRAFASGLGKQVTKYRFRGTWEGIEDTKATIYVSGEAAVPSLIRPETLTIYSDELPIDLIRKNRWVRDEERPNIIVRRKFWNDPIELELTGFSLAPWLLTYADLLESRDSRQMEIAEEVRRMHL